MRETRSKPHRPTRQLVRGRRKGFPRSVSFVSATRAGGKMLMRLVKATSSLWSEVEALEMMAGEL